MYAATLSSPVSNPASKAKYTTGWIISAVIGLFLLFDGVIHVLRIDPVDAAFAELGFPASSAVVLGIIELVCIALYLLPRTSILGAVLTTGYLGGAIATQIRAGNPLFSHTLFPLYVGILLWGGLLLRDSRVISLIAPRR